MDSIGVFSNLVLVSGLVVVVVSWVRALSGLKVRFRLAVLQLSKGCLCFVALFLEKSVCLSSLELLVLMHSAVFSRLSTRCFRTLPSRVKVGLRASLVLYFGFFVFKSEYFVLHLVVFVLQPRHFIFNENLERRKLALHVFNCLV